MKQILLITILLLYGFYLVAQTCLPGGITFITQVQIDLFPVNYPDCTFILGDVTIGPSINISNLSGLYQLETIGGDLIVNECESLHDFTGLEDLSAIGGNLYVVGNDNLANLNGLEDLSGIGESLHLEYNSALSSLSSLENLTSLNGGLGLNNNNALTSLHGLQNIDPESIVVLSLQMNPNLSTCEVQSICDYLENPSNIAVISGNAMGCGNRLEVEEACDAPLPVELLNFTAIKMEKEVILEWQTTSEKQNAGFEIQRSKDGRNWDNIGFVEGIGTTNSKHEYQFMDSNPLIEINYYRLKQVDYDGAFKFSPVVSVEFLGEGSFQIFPNPTTGIVNVEASHPGTLKVMDNLGRLIVEKEINSEQIIDISPFPSGTYSVQIFSDGHPKSSKLIFKE